VVDFPLDLPNVRIAGGGWLPKGEGYSWLTCSAYRGDAEVCGNGLVWLTLCMLYLTSSKQRAKRRGNVANHAGAIPTCPRVREVAEALSKKEEFCWATLLPGF
jgi:hypothetical protein